jgi:hypothetical protein
MQQVRRELRERMRDIVGYLRVLKFIEQHGGIVTLRGQRGASMPVVQSTTYVLKAGVFLHLYNLVESTVTAGLEHAVERIKHHKLQFRDLEDRWQKAWTTGFAKLDEDLAPEKRLTHALRMCKAVSDGVTVEVVPKLGAGNLDDRRIEDMAQKYGIPLALRASVLKSVKYHVYNDLGFLGLVRDRRNRLAHGHDSFADIGKDYTSADLARWSWATYQYLKEIVASFDAFVAAQRFRRKPAGPDAR